MLPTETFVDLWMETEEMQGPDREKKPERAVLRFYLFFTSQGTPEK